METLPSVRAVSGRGLEGDRYFSGTGSYSQKADFAHAGREITLIEAEALEAVLRGDRKSADDRGVLVAPEESRRNIVTRGVPLNHLVDREFFVGEVRMVGTRLCEPCKYLENLLARPGVLLGLIHRGGLRARIIRDGQVEVGSVVRP